MQRFAHMKANPVTRVQPLFSVEDKRRRIPIAEVAEKLGYRIQTLRRYAIDGTIPGGRQAGPGKQYTFDRDRLEAWWQEFNQTPACK